MTDASKNVSPGTAAYHRHLDVCVQCERNPFDQCAIGSALLLAAVDEHPLAARKDEAELRRVARGAWHLLQSLLAVREGPTDEGIREMADALDAAIRRTDHEGQRL